MINDELRELLQGIRYELRVANWMNGGRRGPRPTMPTPPPEPITMAEYTANRAAQREHLRQRRQSRGAA